MSDESSNVFEVPSPKTISANTTKFKRPDTNYQKGSKYDPVLAAVRELAAGSALAYGCGTAEDAQKMRGSVTSFLARKRKEDDTVPYMEVYVAQDDVTVVLKHGTPPKPRAPRKPKEPTPVTNQSVNTSAPVQGYMNEDDDDGEEF